MKLNLKSAFVAAALAVGATAAHATIPTGSIVLTVWDNDAGNQGVAEVTGLNLASWNPAANFSVTLTDAAVVAAFNQNAAGTTWNVVGGFGTNYYTSVDPAQTVSQLGVGAGDSSNAQLTARNQMSQFYGQLTAGVITNSSQTPWAGSTTQGFSQLGEFTDNLLASNTGSLNFASLDASANASLYSGKWTLTFLNASGGAATQGTATQAMLSWTSTAVPLPAAVWLLGSGLAGLAGVGRRRQKTEA